MKRIFSYMPNSDVILRIYKDDDGGLVASQSPQIGSMFLTQNYNREDYRGIKQRSQSPQIGSMFLTKKGGIE